VDTLPDARLTREATPPFPRASLGAERDRLLIVHSCRPTRGDLRCAFIIRTIDAMPTLVNSRASNDVEAFARSREVRLEEDIFTGAARGSTVDARRKWNVGDKARALDDEPRGMSHRTREMNRSKRRA